MAPKPLSAEELTELLQGRFELVGEVVFRDGRPLPPTNPNLKRYRRVGVGVHEGRPRSLYYHRLKFFLAYGYSPPEVDHKDLNISNDALENLRAASPAENSWNRPPRKRDLPRGVFTRLGRYRARLRHNGRQIYVGTFDTAEEASRALEQKSKELRGGFHRYRRKAK